MDEIRAVRPHFGRLTLALATSGPPPYGDGARPDGAHLALAVSQDFNDSVAIFDVDLLTVVARFPLAGAMKER